MPNYLYILVRTDMESLGRGKSVAQGAHAANAFTWDYITMPAIEQGTVDPAVIEWCNEAKDATGRVRGFGTTIALGATLKQIEDAVTIAQALEFKASLVADPEYPLLDGRTLHLLPHVVTTAYVFGDKAKLEIVLRALGLLENDPVNVGPKPTR